MENEIPKFQKLQIGTFVDIVRSTIIACRTALLYNKGVSIKLVNAIQSIPKHTFYNHNQSK